MTEYSGSSHESNKMPQTTYKMTLKIMTNVPTVRLSFFAKTSDMTSTPSIAPPERIVRPLPMPEINPPKTDARSRLVPAMGETPSPIEGNTF